VPGDWILHLAAEGFRQLLIFLSSSLNNARVSPALHLLQSTCCVGGFMQYIVTCRASTDRRFTLSLKGGIDMKRKTRLIYAAALTAGVALTLSVVSKMPARAQSEDDGEGPSRVERGLEIAPVKLNFDGKIRELVGLGSYIVNAQASCNDCHSAGTATQYISNPYLRSPFFVPPKKVNTATYLGGGRDFGPQRPAPAVYPHIVSRNLTPDKTGLPVGGRSFSEFLKIFRTGVDLDHFHPNCTPGALPGCMPPPFNGDLLQVMPWPNYQSMTEHDIRAIYEYLSASPA
jgi:hypothetical protein